jgi:hypothetical protein
VPVLKIIKENQTGRNGAAVLGQSDLNTGAANSQAARIFIVENDPVMLRNGRRLPGDRIDQKIP